jgi:hypothetical protein
MFIALVLTSIAFGIAALYELWSFNPVFAILCMPLVVGFIISANLMVGTSPRRTRHGVRFRSANAS